MHNFKPGDLALIIGCEKRDSLIGTIVELVQRVMPGDQYVAPDNSRKKCASRVPAWIVQADGIISANGSIGWAQVNERHLMPLRGDFQPEQQKSKEVEHG